MKNNHCNFVKFKVSPNLMNSTKYLNIKNFDYCLNNTTNYPSRNLFGQIYLNNLDTIQNKNTKFEKKFKNLCQK